MCDVCDFELRGNADMPGIGLGRTHSTLSAFLITGRLLSKTLKILRFPQRHLEDPPMYFSLLRRYQHRRLKMRQHAAAWRPMLRCTLAISHPASAKKLETNLTRILSSPDW